jgi:hypothetical protein
MVSLFSIRDIYVPTSVLKYSFCLGNGGHITIDYIVGSFVVWQATTHFRVIIDDTRYNAVGAKTLTIGHCTYG